MAELIESEVKPVVDKNVELLMLRDENQTKMRRLEDENQKLQDAIKKLLENPGTPRTPAGPSAPFPQSQVSLHTGPPVNSATPPPTPPFPQGALPLQPGGTSPGERNNLSQ